MCRKPTLLYSVPIFCRHERLHARWRHEIKHPFLKAIPRGMNTSSMVVFVRASTSEIVVDNSPNRIRCFLGSELLIAIRCFIGSDCNSIVTYNIYLRFGGIWQHCVEYRLRAVDTKRKRRCTNSWITKKNRFLKILWDILHLLYRPNDTLDNRNLKI